MFLSIYYGTLIVCISLLVLLSFTKNNKEKSEIHIIIIASIIFTYILGMLRSDGVDFANYKYAFEIYPYFIPDIGFQFLIKIYNYIDAPIEIMMLLIGFLNLISIRRLSNHFNISYSILLLLYFSHFFIVRDFAQLRIGLAISIAIIGLTSSSRLSKLVFYLIGSTIHYSIIIFIISFELSRFLSIINNNLLRNIIIGLSIVIIVISGKFFYIFSFFDDRINLYLNYKKANLGLPIDSYNFLLFHLLIIGLALIVNKGWNKNPAFRSLVYLQLFGITTFLSFSNTAIFAYRLSHLICLLYPVLILMSINLLRFRWKTNPINRLCSIIILLCFIIILITRSGSLEIIKQITF